MGSPPTNQLSSEALNQRGVELAERGWLDEALREFGRAIELDQAAPFPLINRASVYLEQGRSLDALVDLVAAVRLAPKDAATRYSLGVFLSRHAGELGIQELETALELEPDHIDTLLQLGATHAAQGEWTAAEAALDAALRIDPKDPLAHRERACWPWIWATPTGPSTTFAPPWSTPTPIRKSGWTWAWPTCRPASWTRAPRP